MEMAMNNQIKERPILFNGAMVSAILGGSKTQTRRVCKDQPHESNGMMWWPDGKGTDTGTAIGAPGIYLDRCPYGQVGDQLWVRETWNHDCYPYPISDNPLFHYRADYFDDPLGADLELSKDGIRRKWFPSIHMPRKASRIQLEITDVRVERLNDCSDSDALSEGYPFTAATTTSVLKWYRELWESINGAGSWAVNPWVWVVEFKVIKP